MNPPFPTVDHFRVSPAVLGPLGVEQLQDPALAVLELIKNSWDALAEHVVIEIVGGADGSISVRDDGHGMSVDEFRSRWLVIGGSHKRGRAFEAGTRPTIGEKGLGRLASFALGNVLEIGSAPAGGDGFTAVVDWRKLITSKSIDEYPIEIRAARKAPGTVVTISDLRGEWRGSHTEFLVTHAQFLAAVPGERFEIDLRVDGVPQPIDDGFSAISRLSEARMTVAIEASGVPAIIECSVKGVDVSGVVFRSMKPQERDPALAGARISLEFFRRDQVTRQLSGVLRRNEIAAALERYQGVRVFRDGINVPPYGLSGDDWASLEKQRTSTGGPTLVPGNSQIVGEVHVSRERHKQFVITAGRSGFNDQAVVTALARYVRWAVRELGTARRAHHWGILDSTTTVPARIDSPKGKKPSTTAADAKTALRTLSQAAKGNQPEQLAEITEASEVLSQVLSESAEALRLYAQLASTGIAATSFAHELRTEFDVVSDAVAEIAATPTFLDEELVDLLTSAWDRIRAFAALFKVIPVKIRRRPKEMGPTELRRAVTTVLELAPPDRVTTEVLVQDARVRIVPVELDALLLNLVTNSLKAIAESPHRAEGRISVRLEARLENLAILVADNGVGIAKAVRDVMFEPLEGQFAEGTGMGLPIMRYIASQYDGTVVLQDEPPKGYETEFLVTLRNVVKA